MLNNFSRNNLNWNKFDYKGVPPGGTGKSERKSWDWGSMFSDTCKNIETSLTSAKDSLVKAGEDVSNRAEAAGKINVALQGNTDGFRNIVIPTQPKGHEAFHNIF